MQQTINKSSFANMENFDVGYEQEYKDNNSNNASIFELEQDNLIERVRRKLAGEVYNPTTGEWELEEGLDPPMNKKGVHHFIIKFGGHLDKNITLSEFRLIKIHEMLMEICTDILEIFWKKGQDFDIKKENMTFIMHILEHNIYANYMRALDGGERKHRETVMKLIESRIDRQEAPKQNTSRIGGLFKNPFAKLGGGE